LRYLDLQNTNVFSRDCEELKQDLPEANIQCP